MITLKTLPQATKQEIFNQVKNHLLKQNSQSRTPGNHYSSVSSICAYRGLNGNKCAGGCLIDDEEYTKDFEGKTWSQLLLKDLVPDHHATFIRELQIIHDSYYPERWELKLKQFAESNNLIY